MAVQDWHGGQLVVAWVAVLASVPFSYGCAVVAGGFLGLDWLAGALVILLPFVAFVWMLRVSWVWFGSRRSPERGKW